MKLKCVWISLFLILLLRPFILGLIPLIDTTEGRYALVAKEMADSGNFVTPTIIYHGKMMPYWGKPPLYFWMAAFCIANFGPNEFSVRFPAYLSSLSLLFIMFAVLRRYSGLYVAVASVLITATSGAFYMMGGGVEMDMTLSLFATGALFFYFAFTREKNPASKKILSLLISFFLALGFLTKGPACLVFFGVPVFFWTLLNNRWKMLKAHAWRLGVPLFLLITVPWFIMAEAATPGFLRYFFVEENLLRYISRGYGDLYGHGHLYPYGSAIIMMFIAVLPWVIICPALLIKRRNDVPHGPIGIKEIKHFAIRSLKESEGNIGFFLCGFVSITLFWVFARQLLVTYLIPAVPLWSAWCAYMLRKNNLSLRLVGRITLVLAVLYTLGHLPMMWMMDKKRSTRGILKAAFAYRKDMNLDGKIIFVRKTPYSAYFYGQDLLLSHPDETVEESIRAGMSRKEKPLYIANKKYLSSIPSELMARLSIIGEQWRWALLAERNDTRA